jgi:hypothetical protein
MSDFHLVVTLNWSEDLLGIDQTGEQEKHEYER